VARYDTMSVFFQAPVGYLDGDCWLPSPSSKGTVLLLHGRGSTRHSWGEAGPVLAAAGWTTFAIDLRGHGGSDWALDGDYGVDALVDDLYQVVQSLAESPVVIGASLGGLVGLVLAAQYPELLRALVLVDAALRPDPEQARRVDEVMRSAPGGFGTLAEVDAAIRAYRPHRTRPIDPDTLSRTVRRGEDGRWYWHWDPALVRPPGEAAVSSATARIETAATKVRTPTFLVRGATSDVVTESGAADLLTAIPDAAYVDITGAGHLAAPDGGAVFLSRVQDYLDSLVPARDGRPGTAG
jgi:pimeloyl-ACP methyl ester carboxylesterase